MQKYEKYKEAVKPLKRLILADAATVFVRIGKEEEKIHRKVLSAEASLQKLAAMSEKEKEDEKIKKKISAAEKKIEDAKRKEKEFCIAVKPMYAAIADVIEHQKERPMTLWFEILDDEIAATPGVKIEEHVVYATCVVKVTKENFAGQEGLDGAFEQGGFEEIGDEQARFQYGEGDPGRNGVFRHVPQNQRQQQGHNGEGHERGESGA